MMSPKTYKQAPTSAYSLETDKSVVGILGSGWLGMPLAQSLIGLNHEIHLSSRSTHKKVQIQSIGAKAFCVDIEAEAEKPELWEDFLSVDILIINITSKHIDGYKRLIHAIERSNVASVLFISATSVYSDAEKIILEEDTQYLKPCPLLTIEQLFQASTQFNTTVLRFSGLMGYTRHPGRFYRKNSIVHHANAPVNMIHRDDCIGLINAIISQQKWNQLFNACADSHPTRKEFYTYMTALANEVLPLFEDAISPKTKVISNQKITQSLNYQWRWSDVMNGRDMFDNS